MPYEPSGLVYDEDVIISMVEAGLGLYPSAKWYHGACREKVACVDLELDMDNMQIIIAWRKSDHRPVLQDFVDIAQRYFAGEEFQLSPPLPALGKEGRAAWVLQPPLFSPGIETIGPDRPPRSVRQACLNWTAHPSWDPAAMPTS